MRAVAFALLVVSVKGVFEDYSTNLEHAHSAMIRHDTNADGHLSMAELTKMMDIIHTHAYLKVTVKLPQTESEASALMRSLDTNGDGLLSSNEFSRWSGLKYGEDAHFAHIFL